MSAIKTWNVRIKDNRQHYGYYSKNTADKQKEQEKFINTFYGTINKIVDMGALIDPGKYFSEYGNFNIRATEDIANKIGKLEEVESVRKGR